MAQHAIPFVHRFTREEYHRMAAADFFASARVELLEGEVVHMSPQLTPHAYAVTRLARVLITRLGDSAVVRIQAPVAIDGWSEPEPDVAVCRPDPREYLDDHPAPVDIQLLVEVADSSLAHDLGRKLAAYAAAGIGEYWVVNLVAPHVHVFLEPDRAERAYRDERVVTPGGTLTLPGGVSLLVDDILPPR